MLCCPISEAIGAVLHYLRGYWCCVALSQRLYWCCVALSQRSLVLCCTIPETIDAVLFFPVVLGAVFCYPSCYWCSKVGCVMSGKTLVAFVIQVVTSIACFFLFFFFSTPCPIPLRLLACLLCLLVCVCFCLFMLNPI